MTSTTATGIAYDLEPADQADAPCVIFLHAGVADRRMWDDQIDALRGEMTLLRLDLRGSGDSVTAPAGPWSHAQDVIDTLDQAGIRAAHLVGASMGAGVAAEVALTAPERVRSLVLVAPGGGLLATLTDDLAEFFAAESAALESGDLDTAVEANIATWVIGKDRAADDVRPAVIDRVRVMQRRAFGAAGLIGDVAPTEPHPEPHERAAELDLPLLLVVGGHDLDTVHDAADRMQQVAPDVQRLDRADAAHLPSMEHPEWFAEVVRDWVAAAS